MEECEKSPVSLGVELRLQVRVVRLPTGALSSSLELLNHADAALFGPEAGLPEVAHSLIHLAIQAEARLQILKLVGDKQPVDPARVASSVEQQVATTMRMLLPRTVEHCVDAMGRIQGETHEDGPAPPTTCT